MMMIVDALRKKETFPTALVTTSYVIITSSSFLSFLSLNLYKKIKGGGDFQFPCSTRLIVLLIIFANILVVRRRGKAMMGIITMWNYIWLKNVFVIIFALRGFT